MLKGGIEPLCQLPVTVKQLPKLKLKIVKHIFPPIKVSDKFHPLIKVSDKFQPSDYIIFIQSFKSCRPQLQLQHQAARKIS